ncbi:coiled-coil domain-containing protein 70-like [Platysternon megacephalum]|uniref:Coiled-coil domain-containing protein 70-like n=1 Tax=Platysternon megacephalum TaxID=55544 RepID=A0A4D9E272_9SAUR|nr:coiled-coil domain-containing protein 70-like [Platysternon megacephalum]
MDDLHHQHPSMALRGPVRRDSEQTRAPALPRSRGNNGRRRSQQQTRNPRPLPEEPEGAASVRAAEAGEGAGRGALGGQRTRLFPHVTPNLPAASTAYLQHDGLRAHGLTGAQDTRSCPCTRPAAAPCPDARVRCNARAPDGKPAREHQQHSPPVPRGQPQTQISQTSSQQPQARDQAIPNQQLMPRSGAEYRHLHQRQPMTIRAGRAAPGQELLHSSCCEGGTPGSWKCVCFKRPE